MENLRSDDAIPIDDESGVLLDPDFGNGVAGPIVRSEVWRKTWPSKPYLHVFSCLPNLCLAPRFHAALFVAVLFYSFLFHDWQFPFAVKFRRLLMCVCVCDEMGLGLMVMDLREF
jgi:hypothetical protein